MEITFSRHSIRRLEFKRVEIKKKWIIETLENPLQKIEVSNIEHHYFKKIHKFEDRWLKVVFNPKTRTVITAYFDRGKKERSVKYDKV